MRLWTVVKSDAFIIVFALTVVGGGVGVIVSFTAPPSAPAASRGIPSIHDAKNGVTCYVHHYNSQESISCVRDLPDAGCAR